MTDVYIEHNPYKRTTAFKVDGKLVDANNSKLNFGTKRLQEFIYQLPEKLIETVNDEEINISFKGFEQDYNDICEVFAPYNDVNCTHIPTKEAADGENEIKSIFKEIQQGDIEELKTEEINRSFNTLFNSNFEIAVVANMSAGKSTLLNALIEAPLLDSKSSACTANLTKIIDNDSEKDTFSATVYNNSRLKTVIKEYDSVTNEQMKELNENSVSNAKENEDISKRTSVIELKGNIPFIDCDDTPIVLIDTPGTNNDMNKEHKNVTFELFHEEKFSKPFIMFVLNADQLTTDNNGTLLDEIGEIIQEGGKRALDRFLFVINRMDCIAENDETTEEKLEEARKHILKHFNKYGIYNPNIIPVSALAGLGSRIRKNGKIEELSKGKIRGIENSMDIFSSPEPDEDYYLAFERYAPLSEKDKNHISEKLEKAIEDGDEDDIVFIHSGMASLERYLKSYIRKYAKIEKTAALVDVFSDRLELSKMLEKLDEEANENQEKLDEIKKKVSVVKKKIEDAEKAKNFQARIDAIDFEKEIEKKRNELDEIITNERIELLRNYKNKKHIEDYEAQRIIDKLIEDSKDIETNLNNTLCKILNRVVKKCTDEIYSEYSKEIKSLTSDLSQLGTITFDKVRTYEHSSIESRLNKHASEKLKDSKETVTVEKTGYYGAVRTFFRKLFGRSTTYTYTAEEDKINTLTFMDKIMADVSAITTNMIEAAGKDAKSRGDSIKEDFKAKFDELTAFIMKKAKEIEEYEFDEKKAAKKREEAKRKTAWIESIQQRVENVIEL